MAVARSSLAMLTRVGFFHFGDESKANPIDALEEKLKLESEDAASKGRSLDDCLIVIPEAFNVKDYNGRAPYLDRLIRDALIRASVDFGTAFVAGLIEETDVLGEGYSSAYLIDGSAPWTLLSRKTRRDSTRYYLPFPGNCDQPTLYRGLCIAALICMDASSNPDNPRTIEGMRESNMQAAQIRKRHEDLIERIRERSEGAPTVLCIPARMGTISSEAVAQYWQSLAPCMTVVVDNAGTSCPSVIRLTNNSIPCSDMHANQIEIRSLV